jgi:hypothetical protein
MKNSIFTLTLSVLALASCTNPIEEMTDKAITEVKTGLLDPNSFELISTEVDTIHYTWTLQQQFNRVNKVHDLWIEQFNKMMKDAEWEHAFGRSASSEIEYAKIYLDSAKVQGNKMEVLEKQISSLTGTPLDSIIGYTVDIRYYATSRGGDKTMGENRYYVFNNGKTDLEDISPLAKL